MKSRVFTSYMLRKKSQHNQWEKTAVVSGEAHTGAMFAGIESAAQLQKNAADIKVWLRDHPAADPAAIEEQRRRLKEILQQIAGTVK